MTTTFKATAITATTAVLTAVALSQDSVDWLDFPFGFAISSLAVTGWLLAVRRPDNSIGWILSLAGASLRGIRCGACDWRLGRINRIGGAFSSVALFAALGLVLGPLLVMFPTGSPPTPRWWWVV